MIKKRNRGIVYMLENIDPVLWKQVKKKVELEGRNIRWVLLDFLKKWVAEK